MRPDKNSGADTPMTVDPIDAPFADMDADMTELERQVAANEHTEGGGSGSENVRVARRHGIWTVTEAGTFVGDYHDPEAAIAAAERARHRTQEGGEDIDGADAVQRPEEKANR